MKRVQLLQSVSFPLIPAACGSGGSVARGHSLELTLAKLLDESRARCSISLSFPFDDFTFARNATTPVPAASVAKVLIMLAALDNGASLLANLQRPAGGVHKQPRTLASLLEPMIVDSDNEATNIVLQTLGIRAVNTYAANHGYSETHIFGYFSRKDDPKGRKALTSSNDIESMLKKILAGATAETARSDRFAYMLDLLLRQKDKSLIESGIPRAISTANKTGEKRGILNDALIVAPFGRPLTAVLLISDISDIALARETHRRVAYAITDFLYNSRSLPT
jgi:beta-lactamase class A